MRILVIALGALILGAAAAPTLAGYLASTGEQGFCGVLQNPVDGDLYLMWIQEAAHTDGLLLPVLHNPDSEEPCFFNLLWVGLGKVGMLTGLSPRVLYHCAHLLGAAVFLVLLWSFCRRVFPNERDTALVAWLLAGAGGGLGWLVTAVEGQPYAYPHGPPDVWAPEMTVFTSLSAFPHFAVSLALYVGGLLLVLGAVETGRKGPAWAAAGVLCALGLVHVYDIVPAGAALACWLALLHLRGGRDRSGDAAPVRELLSPLLLGLVAPVAFFVVLTRLYPELEAWNRQNLMLSPPPWEYLLALGIPGLVACAFTALGFRRWARHRALSLCAMWFAVTWPLLYTSPLVPWERRFTEGWWIPTAILAAAGTSAAFAGRPPLRRAALALLLLAALPGTVIHVVSWTARAAETAPPAHRSADWRAGCEALGAEAGVHGGPALATADHGRFLPTCARVRVWVGHPHISPDHSRRAWEAAAFFAPGWDIGQRADFLLGTGATHVFAGPRQRGPALDELIERGVLRLRQAAGDVAVYAVVPPEERPRP